MKAGQARGNNHRNKSTNPQGSRAAGGSDDKQRGTRGDGSIYLWKRKPPLKPVWVASLELPPDPETGKRRRKKFYGSSRKEAADRRRAYVKSPDATVEQRRAKGGTVGAVGKLWLKSLERDGRKRNTIAAYRSLLTNHVDPSTLAAIKVEQVTREHVRQMQASLHKRKASLRTQQAVHGVLNGLFRYAAACDMIAISPMHGLRRPGGSMQARVRRKEIRAWNEEEVRTFLAHARPTHYGPLFETMLGTGLRPGEAFALRWRDVDLGKKTITVRETMVDVDKEVTFEPPKTRQARRTIRIGASSVRALGARGKRDELVFTSGAGTPCSRDNVRRALTSICSKAEVPRLTPHELRHTHASLLLARGTPIKVVSERLGHRDVTTTLEVYQHLLPGMGERAADEIDAVLNPVS